MAAPVPAGVSGPLSPNYRDALAAISGWDRRSTRKEREARWQQRLVELRELRNAGRDWPRHARTDEQLERTLGTLLHGQRINYQAGRLAPAKLNKLNELLPGWR